MAETTEAIEVTWARRRENIRGAIKLFRVAVDAIQRHAAHTEAQCGISDPQLWILWELAHAPGMRVLDLAKALAIHVSSARGLTTQLETLGLVRRIDTGPTDNAARLALTDAGTRLLRRAPAPAQGVLTAALESLDDQALADLILALRPLVAAMGPTQDRAALIPLADTMRVAAPGPEPRRNSP